MRNGAVEEVTAGESEGIGVRVRVGGGWGFAATREPPAAGAEEALARALAIAEAQPRRAGDRRSRPRARRRAGTGRARASSDPFAVSLEDKLELLLAAEAALRGDPRIVRTRGRAARADRTRKAFASTEGAACTQALTECGGGIAAVAVGGGELQVRSYPSAHGGDVAAGRLGARARRSTSPRTPRASPRRRSRCSRRPPCPAGRTTLVLDAEQLALQVHESIGHALELDRILARRGLLRRHELGRRRATSARCATAPST